MQYYKEIICVGLKNGTIKKYERQIKYELQPKYKYNNETILSINYVADFVITYTDNSVVVVDVKGLPDSTSKIKKKLFHFKYPDINYIWMGRLIQDGGWLEFKEIEKARKKRKKQKASKTTITK